MYISLMTKDIKLFFPTCLWATIYLLKMPAQILFQDSQGYVERPCFKNQTNKNLKAL